MSGREKIKAGRQEVFAVIQERCLKLDLTSLNVTLLIYKIGNTYL